MQPTNSTHPNSRRVTVFRNPSFLSGSQTKEVQEYLATGNETVGAYFESRNSPMVGSGLTIAEKKYLLPELLGISPEDRVFVEKCNEFYAGMNTSIPYENGKELEIGLETNNDKPLFEVDKNGVRTFSQMPINLADYIRYRHIKGHPKVAGNREEAEGNSTKDFYIFDPAVAEKVTETRQDLRDEAIAIYLTIIKDPAAAVKVAQMLTLLEKDPRDVGTAADQKGELKRLAEANPKKFKDTFEDKNFENRYWVNTFVNTNVWSRAGVSRIVNKEDNKLIGNNMEEALAWMQDKENEELISVFKTKAQEAMKAKRHKTKGNQIVRS